MSKENAAAVDGGATAAYVYDAGGRRTRNTTSSGSVDYLYDLRLTLLRVCADKSDDRY